ncbi:hypothetical protein GWI33_011515 [Rhynchophorus ferrugineus]|uniref:Uncharacterized protein n=1 Tax=Rhynchophorus ferrugineus TaxID=354439 RepID=A0A834MBH6_RHYFE|nr:hypothetical protein GWI33_011515 [Rhynchophorus ferrugineus]
MIGCCIMMPQPAAETSKKDDNVEKPDDLVGTSQPTLKGKRARKPAIETQNVPVRASNRLAEKKSKERPGDALDRQINDCSRKNCNMSYTDKLKFMAELGIKSEKNQKILTMSACCIMKSQPTAETAKKPDDMVGTLQPTLKGKRARKSAIETQSVPVRASNRLAARKSEERLGHAVVRQINDCSLKNSNRSYTDKLKFMAMLGLKSEKNQFKSSDSGF